MTFTYSVVTTFENNVKINYNFMFIIKIHAGARIS